MITGSTRLSELRSIAQNTKPSRALIGQRMVRTIQDSMRVEGYPVSQRTIRQVAREVLRTWKAGLDVQVVIPSLDVASDR